MFLCLESSRKGRFTVPGYVLQSLPPTRPDTDRSLGFLLHGHGLDARPRRVEADGVDFGVAFGATIVGRSVVFR